MRLAVLMLLAACGDDGVHHLGDAAVTIDTQSPNDVLPTAKVTVSISSGGLARPGIRVIITNPDGSAGGETATDSTGAVEVAVPAGSTLTAVNPFSTTNGNELYSYVGVKPGDLLEMRGTLDTPPRANMTATLPLEAGAASYFVYAPCGGGLPSDLVFYACGPSTPLLAVALDANSQPIASLYENAAPVADGSSLDLTAVPFTDTTDVTYTYAHVPATLIDSTFLIAAAQGLIYANGVSADVSSGSATVTVRQPALAGHAFGFAEADFSDSGTGTLHRVYTWGVGTTLDFTGKVLPSFGSSPAFDPVAGSLTWTPTGGDATPDGAVAVVYFGTATPVSLWHVVGPYQDGTLAFPKVAGFQPAAADVGQVLQLRVGKAPSGYDAIRAAAFAGLSAIVVGASGVVLETEYRQLD